MDLVLKKVLDFVTSGKPEVIQKGLGIALQERVFFALPKVKELFENENPAIAAQAKGTAVALTKELLGAKIFSSMEPLLPLSREIVQSQEPQYLQSLEQSLQEDDPQRIIQALIRIKHFIQEGQARDLLHKFIAHTNKKIRATAVLHIGMLASKTNADVLTKYLKDSDNRVKANAIEVLELLNNKNLIPILSRFRKDANNRIRANVLKALSTLGNVDVHDDLKSMLQSESHLMRTSAVWAIGEIGFKSRQYLGLLDMVSDDENPLVRDNLLIALKKVGNVTELEPIRKKLHNQIKNALRIKAKIVAKSDIEVRKEKKVGYHCFYLSGSINAYSVLALRIQLDEKIDKAETNVLEFSKVSSIDSSGIGYLVNLNKKLDAQNGSLFICGCNYRINELFQINKIDSRLNVFQTEEEVREFISM